MFHVCRRGFDILLRETSFSLIPFSLPLHIFFVASSSCLEQHEQYLTWHAFHNKKFFLPQSRKGLPLLFILYPLSFFDQEYIAVSVSWTSCHRSLVLFVCDVSCFSFFGRKTSYSFRSCLFLHSSRLQQQQRRGENNKGDSWETALTKFDHVFLFLSLLLLRLCLSFQLVS